MKLSEDSKKVSALYRAKAGESFKARFGLLLYYRIVESSENKITKDELDRFEISGHEEILNEYIHVY